MYGFAYITMHVSRVCIVTLRHGRQHNSSNNSWGMTTTPCQPPATQQRSSLFSSYNRMRTNSTNANTRATSGEIPIFVAVTYATIKDSRSLPFFVSRGLATSSYRPPCRAYMWTTLPLKTGMASVGARSVFYMTGQRSPLVVSHQARPRDL